MKTLVALFFSFIASFAFGQGSGTPYFASGSIGTTLKVGTSGGGVVLTGTSGTLYANGVALGTGGGGGGTPGGTAGQLQFNNSGSLGGITGTSTTGTGVTISQLTFTGGTGSTLVFGSGTPSTVIDASRVEGLRGLFGGTGQGNGYVEISTFNDGKTLTQQWSGGNASDPFRIQASGSQSVVIYLGTAGTMSFPNDGAGASDYVLHSTSSGMRTWTQTPSSANLATAVTDETGSGALVFGTNPSITTGSLSSVTISGGTLSGTIALTGTLGGGTVGTVSVGTMAGFIIALSEGGYFHIDGSAADRNIIISDNANGADRTTTLVFDDATGSYTFPAAGTTLAAVNGNLGSATISGGTLSGTTTNTGTITGGTLGALTLANGTAVSSITIGTSGLVASSGSAGLIVSTTAGAQVFALTYPSSIPRLTFGTTNYLQMSSNVLVSSAPIQTNSTWMTGGVTGVLALGSAASGTSGALQAGYGTFGQAIFLQNRTSAPATPVGGVIIYGSAGATWSMGTAGTATQIAPP